MLIADGHVLWLTAIVLVLIVAAVISLITSDSFVGEPAKPVTLADEKRVLLQGMAFQMREQRRSNNKKKQRKAAAQIDSSARRETNLTP